MNFVYSMCKLFMCNFRTALSYCTVCFTKINHQTCLKHSDVVGAFAALSGVDPSSLSGFATSHLWPVFPHSSGDNVNVGP